MIKKVILALSLLLAAATSAAAQFADQATYAGAGAGTANAQTLTIANASSYADLLGVVVKYVPTATNTGAATLTVNAFGSSPAFRKPSGSGVTALTGGEIVSGQPTEVMYDGTFFNLIAPVTLPVGAANLKTSAVGFNAATNLQINASVGSNQLTIALKGGDGSDPSTTNPVLIAFRDSTIANGGPVVLSLTSSLSFTINSTNTMGCVSGQMCRLWVLAVNNGGTVGLCAFNALSGVNVTPINEVALQSSASGTSGGSSAQTYYCNISSIASKAIRILGYVEISESVAGTWASGPTYVQLFGPGIKKPGDVVQVVQFFDGSVNTGTGVIPVDDTIPQNTEGDQYISASISPSSAANILSVESTVAVANNGGPVMTGALFRDSTANAIAATTMFGDPSRLSFLKMNMSVVATATTSTTFKVRAGGNGAGTTTFNGASTTRLFGGVSNSYMILKEIMSSLEPANDDFLGSMIPKVG